MSSTTSNASSCDVVELTEEEGRKFFDEVTRAELGMPGEEFLRRYDAGDFRGIDDPRVVGVIMLIPFARTVEADTPEELAAERPGRPLR